MLCQNGFPIKGKKLNQTGTCKNISQCPTNTNDRIKNQCPGNSDIQLCVPIKKKELTDDEIDAIASFFKSNNKIETYSTISSLCDVEIHYMGKSGETIEASKTIINEMRAFPFISFDDYIKTNVGFLAQKIYLSKKQQKKQKN